ncbi:alpha/beta hydrolase [Hymenobacter lapidiphilus]|nr:alpha/beta hydrolase [Hymenobacter sp. CCM 8763]
MSSALKRNNVHIMGTGPRTLLFVNGFGCDQSIWRFITPSFSSRFQLVLFDHVGAGLSESSAYDPDKHGSLQGYAQDLLDICQELNLTDITLIGHSVGAMIGMLAAIEAPEYFRQLQLLCLSPCYLNKTNYHGGFDQQDLEQMLAFMDQDFMGWVDTFAPFVMGNPDQPSLAEELLHSLCQNDPTIAKRFARVIFLSDNRPDVSLCKVPCLFIQCARDMVAPVEVGDFLQATLPTSELVTLPVSGHCPHVSAPALTREVMETFLAA